MLGKADRANRFLFSDERMNSSSFGLCCLIDIIIIIVLYIMQHFRVYYPTICVIMAFLSSASSYSPSSPLPSTIWSYSNRLPHRSPHSIESSLGLLKMNRRTLFFTPVLISNLIYRDPALAISPSENTKIYTDPQGLFSLLIPKRYFVIRRDTNGDDSSRSGSSIVLTAGDLSKAQVVSIERFAVTQLLQQQAGIQPDSLSLASKITISDLGTAQALVQLLVQRRDRDRTQQLPMTRIVQDSVRSSEDNQSITFQLMTDIPVQKPELLMEQYGVNQLIRLTLGKASVARTDGSMMVVYASGLQQDLVQPDGTWTEDGRALQQSVESFAPIV